MTAAMVRMADARSAGSRVDDALALALADELVALTLRLSDMAYDLGSDPETLRRHMTSLQEVDAVTQAQLAIAEMLRSTAPVEERISTVTLADLASRLADGYRTRAAATADQAGRGVTAHP